MRLAWQLVVVSTEMLEHLAAATTMYSEMDMRFWPEQARTGMDEASE